MVQGMVADIRAHHTPEDPLGTLPAAPSAASELWEALLTGRLRAGSRHWLVTSQGAQPVVHLRALAARSTG